MHTSKLIDIQEILTVDKSDLNIKTHEKRLIMLAFIKTNFHVRKSYKINCEGTRMTFACYDKTWRRYFGIGVGVKIIQDVFEKEFERIEQDGKIIIKKKQDEAACYDKAV